MIIFALLAGIDIVRRFAPQKQQHAENKKDVKSIASNQKFEGASASVHTRNALYVDKSPELIKREAPAMQYLCRFPR